MAGLFVSEETVMKAEKARPRPCILWPLEPVRFASPGRLAGGEEGWGGGGEESKDQPHPQAGR